MANLCKDNCFEFKEMLGQMVIPFERLSMDKTIKYISPGSKQCLLKLLYNDLFHNFTASSKMELLLGKETEILEMPQKFDPISKLLTTISEFLTGPCVVNQNSLNECDLTPILHVITRNERNQYGSVWNSLQRVTLLFLRSLVEGGNPVSTRVVEIGLEPNIFFQCMCEHLSAVYIRC